MKTERYENNDGVLVSFGLPMAYIGLRSVVSILTANSRVTNVRRRRPFGASADIHVRFQFESIECIVFEPYGDNSYYHVAPEERTLDMSPVLQSFLDHDPVWYRLAFGDLVTFEFLKR